MAHQSDQDKSQTFHIVRSDPDAVRAEQTRLLDLIRKVIPHGSLSAIGSTAIDGVIGKGDLDFALGVSRDKFDLARSNLEVAFTRDLIQLSNDEFQGFVLPSNFDASLQLFVSGGEYDTFDKFLELLRNDAELRKDYNDLKLRWDGKPMDQYRDAKRRFIERTLP